MALDNADVRRAVYDGLHASPFRERKLHFRGFLLTNGSELLNALEQTKGARATVLAALDSIMDLEFYMPIKEHWLAWQGGADLMVVTMLKESDPLPTGFDLHGSPVRLESKYEAPITPTLSLVRVETDFSRPGAAPLDPQRSIDNSGRLRQGFNRSQATPRSTRDAGPGLYLVGYDIPNRHESFPSGGPELEFHVFVENGVGNFVDVQCAGEEQQSPFQFDYDGQRWTGSEVQLVPESGIGTSRVAVGVWEDDDTACTPTGGRPPRATSGNMDQYANWGSRSTVSVSLVSGNKVIGFENVTVPLIFTEDDTPWDADDEIGEARPQSCWPSSGPTRFDLNYSDSGHPANGWVWLDFRFGSRSPVCETPPPGPLSVSISGPSDVPPSDVMCMWFAVVSGGTGSNTYEWTGVKTGSNHLVWGSPTSPGWLYLHVTSGDQEADAEFFVNVYSEAPACEG